MLTAKQIEAARFGNSPDRMSDGNGLYIRLYKGGGKTFQLRETAGTKTRWITLGRFPDMSLKDARLAAALKKAGAETSFDEAPCELQADPPVANGMPNHVPTFQDFAKIWFERKKQGLSNGKHIQQNWSTLVAYIFPHFGHLPLDEIRQRHILAALDPIWRVKHETAKRTLGRVKEVFELARVFEHVEVNPAEFNANIALGRVRKEPKHHAALDWQRIPDLWRWLVEEADEKEDVRQLMMVMLLSAKRTKEVRFTTWQDIDTEAGIWTSEKEVMKMRREHRIPVSRQLAQVFENMRLLNGDRVHVFARPKNKSGVICENRGRLGFKEFDPGITGHGMRTSVRTWARKRQLYERDVMETALSHEKDKVVQAYMRDDLVEERRQMMQDWADFVTGGTMPPSLADQL